MLRLKPIRKVRPRTPARAALRGANAAFWLVLALGVALGGQRAVEGFPKLVGLFVPSGLLAAQASDEQPRNVVTLPIFLGDMAQSLYAPQVLYPVVAHEFPEWMTQHQTDGAAGSVAVSEPKAMPKIAIVIDDLGADPAHARRAMALPAQVALSFLPFPDATPALAREAQARGHEILVHVPMEAVGKENPGPMALLTDQPAEEIVRRLDWALGRVPGFVGINNHMGSKFTASRTALIPVVERLADRHVFFFDSRTGTNSLVVTVARAFGVASAARDVFLDDVQTPAAVTAQLAQLERRAKEEGIAVAIGHPHDVTLAVLANWTAHEKGFELVTLAAAIRLKTERELSRSLTSTGR